MTRWHLPICNIENPKPLALTWPTHLCDSHPLRGWLHWDTTLWVPDYYQQIFQLSSLQSFCLTRASKKSKKCYAASFNYFPYYLWCLNNCEYCTQAQCNVTQWIKEINLIQLESISLIKIKLCLRVLEMFYLNSTLNFGILLVFVFQLEVYHKVDRLWLV